MISIAIGGLWIIGPGAPVAIHLSGIAAFGDRSAALARANLVAFAQGVIVAVIWTLYLLRSHRIAQTYGARWIGRDRGAGH